MANNTVENGTAKSINNSDLGEFVIYSSVAEQVFSSLILSCSTAITVFAQTVLIIAIFRTPSLHESYFYIMAVYCVMDMIIVSFTGSHYTIQFIYGYPPFPSWYWKITTVTGLGVALCLQYHIALIAYERYIYFCKPYSYLRLFSIRRICMAFVLIYVVPLMYFAATEVLIGRVYHASVLTYNLPASPLHSGLQFGFITVPSAAVTLFSTIKVWKLRTQISPEGRDEGAHTSLALQVRKTARMILLISGAFWGTMFPSLLIRMLVFGAGYTWEDCDSRRVMLPSILIRLATFIYNPVSSILHPLIFYHSRGDLKQAVHKIFRKHNSVHM